MANTYTQLHIQLVFAVKGRESLIDKSWREDLYRYITGIVQQHGHKMLQVNGMPDHIHIFIGYNPNQKIPDLVETIKTDTNRYIKRNRLCKSHFQWQTGYGAFSYARSQVGRVVRYIANQEEHHRIKTFKEEYTTMLSRFDIDYEEKYLFEFLDVHSW
jgi:REP element-mobilizing transposase RayT